MYDAEDFYNTAHDSGQAPLDGEYDPNGPGAPSLMVVLLPLLIVASTFLFLLLVFLICILCIRRRRGILLRDTDGPTDLSREDLIESDGGFDAYEARWLESVDELTQRSYARAKDYQLQFKPNSQPSDITLSQFLSIQEKGVSAWSFDPDYELVNNMLVHARTEITFLPDPSSASCVQSNLPLPKFNEVYYWEVKMFDLPVATHVAVGLATKPYPPFRMPGDSRYSVAYHSNGDKSHNYPFTASTYGPSLKEGDVFGVGYRPRSGTVFFTRNGRRMEDAFVGLNRFNLFPTIGADGPCSVHVNLGQSGFVFIEANVKKWGLAPSVGTLAPPPAYGSERGSILLDVGGRHTRNGSDGSPSSTPGTASPGHRTPRTRRRTSGHPGPSSPLRTHALPTGGPLSPPPPITPIDEHPTESTGPSTRRGYMSPTDLPFHSPPSINFPQTVPDDDAASAGTSTPRSSRSRSISPEPSRGANPFVNRRPERHSLTHMAVSLSEGGNSSELQVQVHPPPDSPMSPNPPTPNIRDIHLQALNRPNNLHRRTDSANSQHSQRSWPDENVFTEDSPLVSPTGPPAYSPLDAHIYADGVGLDLPASVIQSALDGQPMPTDAIGQSGRSERRRSGRRN